MNAAKKNSPKQTAPLAEPTHYVVTGGHVQVGDTVYKDGEKIPATELREQSITNLKAKKRIYAYFGEDAPSVEEEE